MGIGEHFPHIPSDHHERWLRLMQLTLRSRLSLCELLMFLGTETAQHIFTKRGITLFPPDSYSHGRVIAEELTAENCAALLDEVVRSRSTHRPDWDTSAFNERWSDLALCLALDGYHIERNRIIAIDPSVDATAPVEDDLTAALRTSGLHDAEEIIASMESAVVAFRQTGPDYVACLTHARVALNDLVKAIAQQRKGTHGGNFNSEKFGQLAAYLRTSGLITKRQEEGVTGVYSFISEGAHGLDDMEAARLGLSLTTGMLYFLVKRYHM